MRIQRLFFRYPAFLLMLISGCETLEKHRLHDPYLALPKKEYAKKLSLPQIHKPPSPAAIPASSSLKPSYPKAFFKPVTLSLTEDVPLKDIFLDLAHQAHLTMVIDPRVQGSLTFYAHQRPAIDVIEEICTMTGQRARFYKGILRIEPDAPFLKNYDIQFLALQRENQSQLSVATDVFSSIDRHHSSMDNGSKTLLKETGKSDFWQELEGNLTSLTQIHPSQNKEKTTSFFTVHKQAGLVTVFATEAQHRHIEEYLGLLKGLISSQVLIEAKIVEVRLKDEFKSGINWNSLKGDFVIQAPLGTLATPGFFNRDATPLRDVFTLGGSGNHLTSVLNFINRFGSFRTLSSPRLTVMNNQPAVFKVATNQVYFRLDYSKESSFEVNRQQEYVSSQVQTVPIGLVMVVQPSINLKEGRVIMTLRPTISRVVDQIEDPAVAIVSKQTQKAYIPQVQVREFNTVIQVPSGHTLILGGLMEERADNEESGVPEISEIPIIGSLFKGKSHERTVTELVVFLRVTIIPADEGSLTFGNPTLTPADQQVYETFTQDPRPLRFQR